MKKILIATTALVATSSIAAAELAMSGSARFGLTYEENRNDDGTPLEETSLEQRIRINFTGIAETDSGVKFEARIRLESNEVLEDGDDSGSAGRGPGGVGFAVSTGGLRVDVGSVSDVLDSGDHFSWAGTGIGFTGFLEQNANAQGFVANGFAGAGDEDANTVKALYTAGDFAVSASYTQESADGENDDNYQIGASYNLGAHKIGATYGSADDNDQWVLGAGGSFGDFGYNAIVGDSDGQDDILFGASGTYAISAATTLIAVVSTGGDSDNDTSYGVGVSHSLGGGVTLGAGVGSNAAGNTAADLGVSFSF